jgi:hypothetical protein
MSKNKPGDNVNRKHRKVVPPSHLARIIAAEQAYTAQVNENKFTYPDPDSMASLSPFKIEELGFMGHHLGDKGEPGKLLVDPEVVYQEVRKALDAAGLKPVTGTDHPLRLEWKAEFLDETKVKHFAKACKAIVECADIVYVEVCSTKGIEALANLVGYQWTCSAENDRGQAYGFLWSQEYIWSPSL